MRLMTTILVAGLLTACAADPVKIQDVAEAEAERLTPPTKALSSFARFELAPMVYSDAILAEEKKVVEAKEFEGNLRAKLEPLLATWNSANIVGASGTLAIDTTLVKLKVISGGARFWAGAFAGDSFIDVDVHLIDKSNGERIANVPVHRNADSMTGAWSIGKSDQNLDQYVVSIIHQYLTDSY